ncbi:cyclophilin-like fold protein [Vibrio vulnificus]
MKINFVFDDQVVTAILNDSPTAQDFANQLPLTVELEDYASTEKIAYLPRKLTTKSAPNGTSAKTGDLAYYAPWGNMAVFYKDSGYASGLIKLGEFNTGTERFNSGGAMKVTIEKVSL